MVRLRPLSTALIATTTAASLALAASSAGAQEYPTRDITNVVVWSAGGGTDVANRVVSEHMAQALGVNINVTNRPGGVAGSLGMSYGYQQPANGYTIVGLSESCVTAAVQGGWDQRFEVWYPFIIGGSPDVISVNPDSGFETLADLVEAAGSGDINAAAGGAGSIHHLNLLALEKGTGADFNFIPYPGSAPAQTAAMTGEVTIVVTSLAEQQQLIRGGRLKPLGMLTPDSFDLADHGTIPSAFDAYPDLAEYLPISQAIGMAVRADAPDEVKAKLTEAFDAALATPEVQKWAEENYYILSGQTGAEASETFADLESLFSWTLWELDAAEVNPEELGIPKP
ncbi:tripartite tricarboxylate transporter substrate binding protein [uncultured Rhodospira sp.]|uniref:tripartite tricarboxylate transporter substrate binding protein n=1 Tax=uncultured Rhodospira sp. TaxID=1936189 RepID=UPI00260C2AC9|nr:tripartite tricarboxylate transporter substrate binding protein [uncultured Rhodospira sp.]